VLTQIDINSSFVMKNGIEVVLPQKRKKGGKTIRDPSPIRFTIVFPPVIDINAQAVPNDAT
jgi:hypothetical protein